MELTLMRTYHPLGTNGELFLNDKFICCTIELPWMDNIQRVSCIPEGKYQLVKQYTEKFGMHYKICNIKGREDIFIHPANNAMKELEGCIAPVKRITGEGQGSESRIAFRKLMDATQTVSEINPIFITIKSQVYAHN